jgi:hypothetical protein
MTDIEAKALALVNEIELERGATPYSKLNRHGGAEAIYRAIERHEAFKQEVSDAITALLDRFVGDSLSQGVINGHLHRFIIPKPKPKPDPLVEVLLDMELSHDQEQGQHDARYLRAKLEARGLEIREKGQ